MNVSGVQTSSNSTSSDFSIEKILSDDVRSGGDCSSAPSWVCCTRYQPPRLPRAVNTSRARRSGRHARVPFTGAQAAALEAAYARSPYLAPPALRALAAALQLRDDREKLATAEEQLQIPCELPTLLRFIRSFYDIKIWFQNRRARERREKQFLVNHPHSIALPATTITQTSTTAQHWMQRLENHSMSCDKSCDSDTESVAASGSCHVWRSVSSSEEDSLISPRCESPIDVVTLVE